MASMRVDGSQSLSNKNLARGQERACTLFWANERVKRRMNDIEQVLGITLVVKVYEKRCVKLMLWLLCSDDPAREGR
jgi:hypothetical protein